MQFRLNWKRYPLSLVEFFTFNSLWTPSKEKERYVTTYMHCSTIFTGTWNSNANLSLSSIDLNELADSNEPAIIPF